MLGQQFYHETMRKIVVSFGTLFNNIQIVRKNSSGAVVQSMKVPLAYGPQQKFLARLNADPALASKNTPVQMTLPRMSFEFIDLTYDPERKVSKSQTFVITGDNGEQTKKAYMPVPYNINFTLYAMAKNSDDALQIVEQILPFFQPDYTLTINDMADMGIKRDVPIILNDVSYEDSYAGSLTSNRRIIYTMTFTAKFYLYGPVTSTSVIKTVQVDQFANLPEVSPTREQRYSVTPNPVSADADDDFGFSETSSFFEDAKNYDTTTGTDVNKT